MKRKELAQAIPSFALERRSVLKTLLWGSASMFAIGAFGPAAFAGPATQSGWRWCGKCEGSFYGVATAGKGVCPADHHPHSDAGSGKYSQLIGEDIPKLQQGGWRWCAKCEGMFYGRASAGKGVCPAGGAHTDAGSGHYAIALGEDSPGRQGGWRWCAKCEGLFYGRATAGMGVCPAGGTHTDTGSGHYVQLT